MCKFYLNKSIRTCYLIIFIFKHTLITSEAKNGKTICAFTNSHTNRPVSKLQRTYKSSILSVNNKTVICPHEATSCYSVRQRKMNESEFTTIIQDCWGEAEPLKECKPGACISYLRSHESSSHPRTKSETLFCCCLGNLCNNNMSIITLSASMNVLDNDVVMYPSQAILDAQSYKTRTIVISLSSVLAVSAVIIVLFLLYRCYFNHPENFQQDYTVADTRSPPFIPIFDIDRFELKDILYHGRFGEVWTAKLNGDSNLVTVKLFNQSQYQHFVNERDIYLLPFMRHPALPEFYGVQELHKNALTENGTVPQYFFVISYAPYGSLASYLKNSTIDRTILCRMAHSIANGLAFLHSRVQNNDKVKPAIAHRDINSRNILVKEDLSCMICDFGFALKIAGSMLSHNDDPSDQASLTDVGTLRYMAPEVLEGAVNLRDCEASLKQIDMYAYGLVLWEVAARCSDLYQGMPVPEHQLPFQAQLGAHPSFEEMQVHVAKNKQRPVFPDVWKDTNQAIRALKETMEECWDPDAEARLTALCVEERISEIAILWQAKNRGITPTTTNICRLTISADGYLETVPQFPDTSNENVPVINPTQTTSVTENHQKLAESSLSTATTDTIISLSGRSDYSVSNKDNSNANSERENRAIVAASNTKRKPSQGMNPTVERNTHMQSDEELTLVGNRLIKATEANCANNITTTTNQTMNLINQANRPTVTRLSVDNANRRSRICSNITYVQNEVGTDSLAHPSPNSNLSQNRSSVNHKVVKQQNGTMPNFHSKKTLNEDPHRPKRSVLAALKYFFPSSWKPPQVISSPEQSQRLLVCRNLEEPGCTMLESNSQVISNYSKSNLVLEANIAALKSENLASSATEVRIKNGRPLVQCHPVQQSSNLSSLSEAHNSDTEVSNLGSNSNHVSRPNSLLISGHKYRVHDSKPCSNKVNGSPTWSSYNCSERDTDFSLKPECPSHSDEDGFVESSDFETSHLSSNTIESQHENRILLSETTASEALKNAKMLSNKKCHTKAL